MVFYLHYLGECEKSLSVTFARNQGEMNEVNEREYQQYGLVDQDIELLECCNCILCLKGYVVFLMIAEFKLKVEIICIVLCGIEDCITLCCIVYCIV